MTEPHPMTACGAKTKRGTPCNRPAGWATGHPGTGRCKLHGGASPQAEIAGQIVLARREARVMGCPLDLEPEDGILELIRIAAGEVAYCSERIAELRPDEAIGPVIGRTVRPLKEEKGAESPVDIVEETRYEGAALHVWIQARRQAMDRLANYCFAALKAQIDERRVELSQQQGALLAQVLHAVLADLGVADRPEVPAVVRRHLTLIAAAQASQPMADSG